MQNVNIGWIKLGEIFLPKSFSIQSKNVDLQIILYTKEQVNSCHTVIVFLDQRNVAIQ